MPIAFPHFLRLVAHPGVDEPLIDATGRTIGRKGMAKDVPAAKHLPFAAIERVHKEVVSFIAK